MESNPDPTIQFNAIATPPTVESADNQLWTVASLLHDLDDSATIASSLQPSDLEVGYQNQLVQVRLGIASSMFTALRAKHAPTASHCLRVALGCSSWATMMQLGELQRDEFEVAALLHDIGKIGVPDHLLLKPAKLTQEEVAIVNRHRMVGEQILNCCSASRSILDVVRYAGCWYDGSKPGFDCQGTDLPFGARMVAILDAYDAMTTDHVYRRAMSRERAIAELFEFAGTQFDPKLVELFCDYLASDQKRLTSDVSSRWLLELKPHASNAFWRLAAATNLPNQLSVDKLFHQKLLDSMHDAVVFVDTSLRILLWNRAAERMTGLTARSVIHKRWAPSLIGMYDENRRRMTAENCPVTHALSTGVQTLRRLTVQARESERLSVDAHMVPVVGIDGVMHGATLLLHDASSQITLEERVQTLHEKATRDPLTKVANRAEFDRVHNQFVETHLERGLPCALIISDIDHFKSVNDTFGHQAGDYALISFAALLQRSCRPGDLVARYGGEEFVMLCADCDNSTATERAEMIRRELSEIPQALLGGKSITASFGVTEIQAGDTPETMLRRADRALLQAKETGRNRVIQLGTGIPCEPTPERKTSWFRWFQPAAPVQLLEQMLITPVPLQLTAAKLRGFVSDHHADVVAAEGDVVMLRIGARYSPLIRRASDRPVPFLVSLRFAEKRVEVAGQNDSKAARTLIKVVIRPTKNRDRRRGDVLERTRQLLVSLKSYFMAHEYHGPFPDDEEPEEIGMLISARDMLQPPD